MIKKNTLIAVIVMFVGSLGLAQTKVGPVDINLVLSKMTEMKQVQDNVQAYTKELDSSLQVKLNEYKTLVEDYQKNVAGFDDATKKTKEQSIVTLENDIQKFRQNGATLLQLRQEELMRPLYEKIGKMVEQVAKEMNYTQILTFDGNHLAYYDINHDISKAVLAKMGIKLE